MAVEFLSAKEKQSKIMQFPLIFDFFLIVVQDMLDKLETVSNVNSAEIG